MPFIFSIYFNIYKITITIKTKFLSYFWDFSAKKVYSVLLGHAYNRVQMNSSSIPYSRSQVFITKLLQLKELKHGCQLKDEKFEGQKVKDLKKIENT